MNKAYDMFFDAENIEIFNLENEKRKKNEIELIIQNVYQAELAFYSKVKSQPDIKIDKKHIDMLLYAEEIRKATSFKLNNNNTYFPIKPHIINRPYKEVGLNMKIAAVGPLLQWEDISNSWNSITELTSTKYIGIFISSVLTLLFGEVSQISQGVYLFAIFHFISTLLFSPFNYVTIWKNLKVLLMIFFWIALAHSVCFWGIVSKAAAELIFNACLVSIGFAEIKGTIECCEAAGYCVPKEIKDLAKLKNPFKS